MPFTGTLNIKIVEAADLKPTQLSVRHVLGKNQSMVIDPFINIAVDESVMERTTVKSRTFKPVWNESFNLELIEAKTLQLTVFHKSALSEDFVANCSLTFEEIQEKHEDNDFWVDLEPVGRLHIFIELINKPELRPPKEFHERLGFNNRRRGAMRRRVHQINAHKFMTTNLRQPTFCSHCNKFIWGLAKQGYQCQVCTMVVHKKCHQFVVVKCPGCKKTDEEDVSLC
ncbi:hypothetical protein BLA29_008888 [Euroglyphus maynei]|uniref:Protein kinase C n=1 Tax=Euroglyphus maynei TaxID=6958 RepID=A0A1Y3BR83_EURMA|nr:hypothetical protein BLA29_008888 [Euroglyphus maynei]